MSENDNVNASVNENKVINETQEIKEIKGYYHDTIFKGKFKKDSFIQGKLGGFNESAEKIAEEAYAASAADGIVFGAFMEKQLAKLYIFTKTGKGDNSVLELTGEYYNESVLTTEIDEAFEKDMEQEMIQLSESFGKIIFKELVINKGDYKTVYSYSGMILGFVIGYLLFGVAMKNMALGICLGLCFAVSYGLIFGKHVKVDKAEKEKVDKE